MRDVEVFADVYSDAVHTISIVSRARELLGSRTATNAAGADTVPKRFFQ